MLSRLLKHLKSKKVELVRIYPDGLIELDPELFSPEFVKELRKYADIKPVYCG